MQPLVSETSKMSKSEKKKKNIKDAALTNYDYLKNKMLAKHGSEQLVSWAPNAVLKKTKKRKKQWWVPKKLQYWIERYKAAKD